MKVLVTIFEELVPLSGGGTPRISNIIEALVKKGHQVHIAASIGVKKEKAVEQLGCVDLAPLLNVSRLSSNKMIKYLYAHPLNIWRVARYARKVKPDLIISHNSIAGYAALWARRSCKECITVLDLTDLLFEYLQDYRSGRWMRLVQLAGKRLERKVIGKSSKIVTISNCMRKMLLTYGAKLDNIEVVSDGVDSRIFERTGKKELREKFAKNFQNIVIFQGVIDPQDDPQIILDAAGEVVKRYPKTMFWIIGDGTALPRLRQKVSEGRLTEYFYFSGWVRQKELARYISASDIGLVILPDILSAQGRVTLKEFEYWACGIPVVAPRLPALEEVIEERKTGVFYQPDDFKSLAEKIVLLIEDKENRKKMGQRGMELVKGKFEWQRLAGHYATICQDFVRGLQQ